MKSEGSQVLFLRVSLFHGARHGHPLTGMVGAYRRSLFAMIRTVLDCCILYQHISFICFPTSCGDVVSSWSQPSLIHSGLLQGNFQMFQVVFVHLLLCLQHASTWFSWSPLLLVVGFKFSMVSSLQLFNQSTELGNCCLKGTDNSGCLACLELSHSLMT